MFSEIMNFFNPKWLTELITENRFIIRALYVYKLKKYLKKKLNLHSPEQKEGYIEYIRNRIFEVRDLRKGEKKRAYSRDKNVDIEDLTQWLIEGRKILVTGDIGMGKTIFSHFLTLEILKRITNWKKIITFRFPWLTKNLPVLITLGDTPEPSGSREKLIEHHLEKELDEYITKKNRENFAEKIHKSKPIYILDALDEYKHTSVDNLSQNTNPCEIFIESSAGVFLTSRESRYLEGNIIEFIKNNQEEKKYQYCVLETFSEKDSVKYLKANLKIKKGEIILDQLQEIFEQLFPRINHYSYLRIPLMLSTLTYDYNVKEENTSTLSTQLEIYLRYYDVLFCHYFGKKSSIRRETFSETKLLGFLESEHIESDITIGTNTFTNVNHRLLHEFLYHILTQISCRNFLEGKHKLTCNNWEKELLSPLIDRIDEETVNVKILDTLYPILEELIEDKNFMIYRDHTNHLNIHPLKLQQYLVIHYIYDYPRNNTNYDNFIRISNESSFFLLKNEVFKKFFNQEEENTVKQLFYSFLAELDKNEQERFLKHYKEIIQQCNNRDFCFNSLPPEANLSFLSYYEELEVKIERMEINCYYLLESFQFGKSMPHLQILKISENGFLSSLKGLPELPNLLDLEISENISLSSLEGLPKLPNLQDLEIRENDSLSSLKGIPKISNLQILKISENDFLSSLEGLPNMPNLQRLKIWENSSLSSLEGLPELRNLQDLEIKSNHSLSSLEGLPNMPNLQRLVIELNISLSSLEELPELPNLQELQIKSNRSLSSLEGLPKLLNLQDLEIWYNHSLSSLKGLPKLPKLQKFRIWGNKGLSSLEGLPMKLNNLKIVSLLKNEKLISFDCLSRFQKIEEFNVEYNSFTLEFQKQLREFCDENNITLVV